MVGQKAIEVPDLRMKTVNHLTIELYMNHEEPTSEDETISLVSDDGSYNQTLSIKEVAKKKGDKFTITFNEVIPDKTYVCEIKFSKDREGNPQGNYCIFKEYKITKDDLENFRG